MRQSGAILFHSATFAALVVVTFMMFLATADNDTWYPRPYERDVGDDDGYFIATLTVMLYVTPIQLVTYVIAVLVARWSRAADTSS